MKKNNKQLQFVLLILVILIWGVIAYQLFNYRSVPELNYVTTKNNLPLTKAASKKDTFSLLVNYPDPFTGNRQKLNEKNGSSQSKKVRKKITSTRPNIEYLGYSLDEDAINRIRVRLNGQLHTLQLRDKLENLRLKAISKDSIILSDKGKDWVVHRE